MRIASKVYFLTTVPPSSQVSELCNPFMAAATALLGQQLAVRLCEENRLDGGFSSVDKVSHYSDQIKRRV